MCVPYNDRSALLVETSLRNRLTLATAPGQYQALVAHRITDSLRSTVLSGSTHLGQKTSSGSRLRVFAGEIIYYRSDPLLQAKTLVTVSPCEFPPRCHPRILSRHPRVGEDPLASHSCHPGLVPGPHAPPRPFVDNLLTVLGLCGSRPVSRGAWRKKAKKQKKFSQNPLPGAKNSSIIGLTLGKGVAEAREAAGKIEGIGDVLSDGSKRFLGIVKIRT